MKKKGPTLAWLERRLRETLLADTTHVQAFVHDHNTGQAEWEEGSPELVVSLDPFWNGQLPTLVHELMHYVLRLDRTWGDLEEPMILGLEKAMNERIQKSISRSRWWRKHLHRKLKED